MILKDNEEGQDFTENFADDQFDCHKEISVMQEIIPDSLKKDVQQEQFVVEDCRPETREERFQRRKSHLVIYLTMFTMSIGFSIVLTGIWPYLKMLDKNASKELLGWVVAANPLGQMIASPLLGWLGTKMGSHRLTFVFTIVLFVIGNVMYSLLPLFENNVKQMMLISRFIVGVSSANMALSRLYISASTKVKERTTALSITAAVQSIGYILGPVIQTVLAFAFPLASHSSHHLDQDMDDHFTNSSIISSEKEPLNLLINMYSLTGWFCAALGCINLLIFLPCVFKEFYIAAKEEKTTSTETEREAKVELKVDYFAIGLCLFSFFTILLIYVLLETLIVPLVLEMYAWEPEFAVKTVGIALTMSGALSVIMFILSGRLAKAFGDRIVYIVLGLLPLTLSMLVFTPIAGVTPKIKYCPSDVTALSSAPHSFLNGSSIADGGAHPVHTLQEESGQCDGVGCPSIQSWCFHTPIIHIPQLIAASFLAVFGYPVGFGLCSAIFSKMLRVRDQGLWLGFLTSAGSLSRFLGPIGVSYVYSVKGPRWTFLSLFSLLLSVLISNVIFYKRLTPLITHSKISSPKHAV